MNLEESFSLWIEKIAKSWGVSIQDVALKISEGEIKNRVQKYPLVQKTLKEIPFNIDNFSLAARECWVLGGKYDSVRFNAFVNNKQESTEIIEKLIRDFPDDEHTSATRIDSFLEDAVRLGFSTPQNTFDWAGALQTASLILTARYPERFTDYRQTRWKIMANEVGYPLPPSGASHGEWLLWAGKFANAIASTPIYKELWPTTDPNLSNPLWVISGICWDGPDQAKPENDPYDPMDQLFPEGGKKRRLHLYRERNRSVISKAKALRLENDPLLRCEVCGFSFVEKYGHIGEGFIEAHHKIPLSDLKEGGHTRVEDIALLCSNCHRMIHSGDKTSTVNELQKMINQMKKPNKANAADALSRG
jgi:5-methylcytosine-specific restriction endonuclease McrA